MSADRGLNVLTDLDQWSRCHHTGTAVFAGPGDSGGIQLTWPDLEPPAVAAGPPARCGLAFDQWGHAYVNRGPDTGHVWRHLSPVEVEPFPAADAGRPVALAVDAEQRLYAAHDGSGQIVTVDIYTQKRVGTTPVGPGRPIDLAVAGNDVAVLTEEPVEIVWLRDRRRTPVIGPRCPEGLRPWRLGDGGDLVLWRHPEERVALICRTDGTVVLEPDGATGFAVTPDGVLVVAGEPGRPFRRFAAGREIEPVRADTYDGGAVAVSADGAVGFSTAGGVGWTAGSAADYRPSGTVIGYRLDSGRYRNRWGRVFLDASQPVGTTVEIAALTTDEDDVTQPLDTSPPARGGITGRPGTPPLPPATLWGEVTWQPLYRLSTSAYEAPVAQPAGRYLWIGLRLTGTGAVTPRVREVRVERTGHRLLDYLPRHWSRDPVAAGFLYRFLTPAEGLLHDAGEQAALRSALLDPAATPPETLPWLAGLTGLTLDDSWPEAARRTLVAEAYRLFAARGTVGGLTRMLEIFLGYRPALIERWRIPGEVDPAHRFVLYLQAALDDDRRRIVEGILRAHAPAHTSWEIRELGAGPGVGEDMRVGANTVALAGALGTPFVIGDSALGVDGLLGGGPS
ncbi:phage tail protein I [Actinoplanes sp. HUAS TT8]|uniref:phage tail protein I n=1 Tax=Actinoplanes sp. HUAS TT8 TaxID=3447453 RepID=UPI003F51FA95